MIHTVSCPRNSFKTIPNIASFCHCKNPTGAHLHQVWQSCVIGWHLCLIYVYRIHLRQAYSHVATPSPLVLFYFQQEYFTRLKRFFTEHQCIGKTCFAIRHCVVVVENNVLSVAWMKSRFDLLCTFRHCEDLQMI